MKKPLNELLAEASKELPPQRPKADTATDYSIFKKVAVKMHHQGHTPRTIVDSLIHRKELVASERKPATTAISKLLTKHFA